MSAVAPCSVPQSPAMPPRIVSPSSSCTVLKSCRGRSPVTPASARRVTRHESPRCGISFAAKGCGLRAASPAMQNRPQHTRQAQSPRLSARAWAASSNLRVSELLIGNQPFDPSEPSMKSALVKMLCKEQHRAAIENVTAHVGGGGNLGVWYLRSRNEDLVLKLVKSTNDVQGMLSEAQSYVELWKRHPSLVNDPAVAFPQRIVRILRHEESHDYDLLVARRVPGETLSSVIQEKWRSGAVNDVFAILEKVGSFVGWFHSQYGELHGDLQLMNIVFDEVSGRVSLIDLGGMGGDASSGADLEHFEHSLGILASSIGESLRTRGSQFFRRGYAQGSRGRCSRQSSKSSDSSLGSVSSVPVVAVAVGPASPWSPHQHGSIVAVPSWCSGTLPSQNVPLATCLPPSPLPRPALVSVASPYFMGYSRC